MINNIFSNEFLREMNYKASLLKQLEDLRSSDNLKYSKLVEKHRAQHKRLHSLPVERLKKLVGDLE